YSVAIVAIERGAETHELDIWATDLNPAAVESATAGRYPTRRMVGVSEERLSKFFIASDEHYEAVPALKKVIRFEGHHLAAAAFAGPIPQGAPPQRTTSGSGLMPAMRITNSGIPGPFAAPSAPGAPRPSSTGLAAIPTPVPSAPEARRTPVERLDKVIALIEK